MVDQRISKADSLLSTLGIQTANASVIRDGRPCLACAAQWARATTPSFPARFLKLHLVSRPVLVRAFACLRGHFPPLRLTDRIPCRRRSRSRQARGHRSSALCLLTNTRNVEPHY